MDGSDTNRHLRALLVAVVLEGSCCGILCLGALALALLVEVGLGLAAPAQH